LEGVFFNLCSVLVSGLDSAFQVIGFIKFAFLSEGDLLLDE